MIETVDYTIANNKFIFKASFNKSTQSYINITEKYDELIFANYNKIDILINNNYNNDFMYDYSNYYIKSKFNNKIELLPNNLTGMIFGYEFNQLINLQHSLTSVTLGKNFN